MTKRQKEVLDLVLSGLTNKKIAEQLFVTESAIKFHVGNIFKEHQVKSRRELILKVTASQGGHHE